jgi:hypothetical protein
MPGMRNSQGISFFWFQSGLALMCCDVTLNRYSSKV